MNWYLLLLGIVLGAVLTIQYLNNSTSLTNRAKKRALRFNWKWLIGIFVVVAVILMFNPDVGYFLETGDLQAGE